MSGADLGADHPQSQVGVELAEAGWVAAVWRVPAGHVDRQREYGERRTREVVDGEGTVAHAVGQDLLDLRGDGPPDRRDLGQMFWTQRGQLVLHDAGDGVVLGVPRGKGGDQGAEPVRRAGASVSLA